MGWRLRVNFHVHDLGTVPGYLADVAELADALDSKSGIRKDVWVRPPPSAPSRNPRENSGFSSVRNAAFATAPTVTSARPHSFARRFSERVSATASPISHHHRPYSRLQKSPSPPALRLAPCAL